jgi:hypothetical protein
VPPTCAEYSWQQTPPPTLESDLFILAGVMALNALQHGVRGVHAPPQHRLVLL